MSANTNVFMSKEEIELVEFDDKNMSEILATCMLCLKKDNLI